MNRAEQITELHRRRPRDRFLRWSLIVVAALVSYSIIAGEFSFSDLFCAKRQETFSRFLENFGASDAPDSARGKFRTEIYSRSGEAVMTTLWISVASIVLAGAGGCLLSGFAARNLATPQPFITPRRRPSLLRRPIWKAMV